MTFDAAKTMTNHRHPQMQRRRRHVARRIQRLRMEEQQLMLQQEQIDVLTNQSGDDESDGERSGQQRLQRLQRIHAELQDLVKMQSDLQVLAVIVCRPLLSPSLLIIE